MALTTAEIEALTPVSAWVLVADESAYPSERVLAEMAAENRPGWCWLAPDQVRPGDLLLFYFTAPLKGIRFAARAASRPFADPERSRAVGEDAGAGWMTHTALVAVPQVSFGDLSDAVGGHLSPRAHSRHYLGPDAVTSLLAVMEDGAGADGLDDRVRDVVRVPSGTPTPTEVADHEAWRDLAPGAVQDQSGVDTHVVGPMLRMTLREGRVVQRRYSVPGIGVADHVVTRDDVPVAVVVSAAGLLEPAPGAWSTCEAFLRLEHLTRALGVPGLLVDANRVLLVAPDRIGPVGEVDRVQASTVDLDTIAVFLAGG